MDRIHTQEDKPANRSPLEQARLRTEQAEAHAEHAKSRAEAAETRTGQAEHRIETAKTRTEQAETRTEQAETRTEQADTRTEQAETRLDRQVRMEADQSKEIPASRHPAAPADGTVNLSHAVNLLTARQREILQLIAQGHNTKEIAGLLHLSPKTVEYHRLRLMAVLNVRDIPGLVRLALRAGVIPPDS